MLTGVHCTCNMAKWHRPCESAYRDEDLAHLQRLRPAGRVQQLQLVEIVLHCRIKHRYIRIGHAVSNCCRLSSRKALSVCHNASDMSIYLIFSHSNLAMDQLLLELHKRLLIKHTDVSSHLHAQQ
jgi:hypothetical protein